MLLTPKTEDTKQVEKDEEGKIVLMHEE